MRALWQLPAVNSISINNNDMLSSRVATSFPSSGEVQYTLHQNINVLRLLVALAELQQDSAIASVWISADRQRSELFANAMRNITDNPMDVQRLQYSLLCTLVTRQQSFGSDAIYDNNNLLMALVHGVASASSVISTLCLSCCNSLLQSKDNDERVRRLQVFRRAVEVFLKRSLMVVDHERSTACNIQALQQLFESLNNIS
jgi:hypothetical protein